jgi:hypothetical protein
MSKIERINQVLAEYFERNKNISRVPAMDLMGEFVKAGIFKSDSERAGLPIRKLLRELDEKNLLDLIPYVIVDRKSVN